MASHFFGVFFSLLFVGSKHLYYRDWSDVQSDVVKAAEVNVSDKIFLHPRLSYIDMQFVSIQLFIYWNGNAVFDSRYVTEESATNERTPTRTGFRLLEWCTDLQFLSLTHVKMVTY